MLTSPNVSLPISPSLLPRPGQRQLVPPCSAPPAQPKSAPGGRLSESILARVRHPRRPVVDPAVLSIPCPAQVGSGLLPFRVYTDYSPARSCCGPWLVPPCLPSPAPLTGKSAAFQSLCLLQTGTLLRRQCGPWLVPPCAPSPAPPKSAPGGCLSQSILTTACHALLVLARSSSAPHPRPRSSRLRAAAFPSLY